MNLEICGLTKEYDGKTVFRDIYLTIEEGTRLCLMGPSGCGKTTLLRILMGLECADKGIIKGVKQVSLSAVFQEDRLLENLSAVKNVWLVCKKIVSENEIREELAEILPRESLDKPVNQLSGGMKRRTALVRAMMKESNLVLMDEPFTGLDEDTKKAVIRYVKKRISGKTFLFSTHQREDAYLLGAQIYTFPDKSKRDKN